MTLNIVYVLCNEEKEKKSEYQVGDKGKEIANECRKKEGVHFKPFLLQVFQEFILPNLNPKKNMINWLSNIHEICFVVKKMLYFGNYLKIKRY